MVPVRGAASEFAVVENSNRLGFVGPVLLPLGVEIVSQPLDVVAVQFSVPVPSLLIWIVITAMLAVVFAILPAWRASRLDVLDAIAYE